MRDDIVESIVNLMEGLDGQETYMILGGLLTWFLVGLDGSEARETVMSAMTERAVVCARQMDDLESHLH